MNDKQEGILFTIDCLNSHKYNFDYNLEELIKEAKQLQSNWNSLREYIEKRIQDCKRYYPCCSEEFQHLLDKINELESGEK